VDVGDVVDEPAAAASSRSADHRQRDQRLAGVDVGIGLGAENGGRPRADPTGVGDELGQAAERSPNPVEPDRAHGRQLRGGGIDPEEPSRGSSCGGRKGPERARDRPVDDDPAELDPAVQRLAIGQAGSGQAHQRDRMPVGGQGGRSTQLTGVVLERVRGDEGDLHGSDEAYRSAGRRGGGGARASRRRPRR
jgi:hypothetical protein